MACPETSCCGKLLPLGLKGQRKGTGAECGESYSQQRKAAQQELWRQPLPNYSLAGELGESKPTLSPPISLLLLTPTGWTQMEARDHRSPDGASHRRQLP